MNYPPHISERIARISEPAPVGIRLDTPSAVVAVARGFLDGREVECVVCVALDSKMRVIDADIMTTGTHDCALFDTRQILRWALTRKRPASGIIIAHNHPSGEASPSWNDDDVTRKCGQACTAVGIKLHDHIITTDGEAFYSYAGSRNL